MWRSTAIGDIRTYKPELRFDFVVGNPPFNLRWWADEGKEVLSQLYYCRKAAELLKPLGILALIVPRSFLADDFSDKAMIHEMEQQFSFLGQVGLPDDAFDCLGVEEFPTKLQLWQKKSEVKGWTAHRYSTQLTRTLSSGFNPAEEAQRIYEQMLMLPKADLEKNESHVILELAKESGASKNFAYQTQKMLYQIKVHPATKDQYAKCCEYLHRYYTQKQPPDMKYKEWQRIMLTEAKVLAYLRRALRKQSRKPERDVIALVKRNDSFVYKAYSAKMRGTLTGDMKTPVPVYQAVLDNDPEQFPGYERLLRRKRREYENQSQQFSEMTEDTEIGAWLKQFTLWDAENEEYIQLNEVQSHDVNLMLQKRYGMLQWEQGSGKTLAAIAIGLYRMRNQGIHSTWVVSSAFSIRNNWDVVLPNYGLSYVFVEKLGDFARIKSGDFVLVTLNKLSLIQRHIKKWVKRHNQNIMLVLDESDEISNDDSKRTKAALSCFRRCRMKLETTGTSTRNNISEFAPQLELPDRPLFTVSGSTKTFAQRRALRKTLRESGNGILLCTQQSLPSSVNFEYVNKILIPEMHYNNSGMSQFYMRFIRYTSTEYKDIYFLNYTGSLESNLLQMVMAKEKINLFMKGQDTDLDQIYEKFGVDYNLLALLMRREEDEKGHFQIRWGEQKIA